MIPKKFRKYKELGKKVESEIREISDLIRENTFSNGKYRLHLVPVNGQKIIAADAKALNKYDNQKGPGCWRYAFDLQQREYLGIAKEVDNGSYRIV
ncbi:hypothetical protein K9L97_02575 [Candidatus Woesearchaeota archaeon]|nr:hypothetical protein [Candidatus Woesearchaeota archaeon]